MNDKLNAFIDKLSNVQTVDDARNVMIKTMQEIGADCFAYLSLHLPDTDLAEPVLVHTYSDEWVDRYLDCNYASIDPVVETGMNSVVPFLWGGDKHRKTLGDESRSMMDEASEFGLSRGFTVPIHGAKGELAAFSVALPKKELEALKVIEETGHLLHLIALYFHANMGEKILAEGASRRITLSSRETECLLWASQGKTVWETSEILKLSEHTTGEYIKNACKKLGVFSKNHAVVKSIMLGLIRPNF